MVDRNQCVSPITGEPASEVQGRTVKIEGAAVLMIDQGLGMDPLCTGLKDIFSRGILLHQSTQQLDDHPMRLLISQDSATASVAFCTSPQRERESV